MAVNTVTSNTGVAVSPVVTFNVRNSRRHAFVYVNYALGNGTSVTLTLAMVNPSIHASSGYEHSVFATATIAAITATFNASGKHRFKIELAPGETSLIATFAFTGGDTQAVICDLYPD